MKSLLTTFFRRGKNINDAQSFYEEYYPLYRSFAYELCSNQKIVENLIQDLFVHLWRNHSDPLSIWTDSHEMLIRIKKHLLKQTYTTTNNSSNERQLFFSRISKEREEQLKNLLGILTPLQKEIIRLSSNTKQITLAIQRKLNITAKDYEKEVGKILQLLDSLPNPNQQIRIGLKVKQKEVRYEE